MKHRAGFIILLPCAALLVACAIPSSGHRAYDSTQYWLQGTLLGTPISGPAVESVYPGASAPPIVTATSDTPFVVSAVTSNSVSGVVRLTLFADITVCTTQGVSVIKPEATWGFVEGVDPPPASLSVQSTPNIANDLAAYDEVDYKITTESVTTRAVITRSPPLYYRFVRSGGQAHGCIP
jgi:hypothetical protein